MAYIIGLDVGGTKIEGILVKATAAGVLPKIVKKIREPTDAVAGKNAVIGNIVRVIAALHNYGKEEIPGFRLSGVGIGTAGFLKNGRMQMTPNIPALVNVRLKDVLLQRLRKLGIKRIFIENDSICFALAEFMFGAARGYKDVIGIIVGTGIGSGLILDRKVYRGRDGGAGHIGHTTVDPSGPRCGCGQRGHFESWCSGKFITKRYVAAGGKIRNPDPHKIFYSKDPVARKIMSETYEKFGLALANIINTFNPEIIVLGGGVSNLPAEFYRKINASAKKYAYQAFSDGIKIVKNRLGDSAGVFGAVALVQKSIK